MKKEIKKKRISDLFFFETVIVQEFTDNLPMLLVTRVPGGFLYVIKFQNTITSNFTEVIRFNDAHLYPIVNEPHSMREDYEQNNQ